MAQDLLQRDDMTATHDEVGSKGMAKDMTRLPFGRLDRGFEQHLAEDAYAVAERAMFIPVLVD